MEQVNVESSAYARIARTLNRFQRLLSHVKDEFIYGGYLTSLGCPAFVLSVSLLLGLAVDWPVLLIAYLVPLVVYSYNYYEELEKDLATNPERTSYLIKKVKLYPILFGIYMSLLILLLLLYANYVFTIFILILLSCGILYTIVFKDLTKQVPGFKGVYIAAVWALAGAFLFNFHYSVTWGVFSVLMFLFIFLRGIINVTFFDIKDVESDRARGLKTLPVLLGRDTTLKFLNVLNIFSFIPLILGVYFGIIPAFGLALLVFYLYDFYYLRKARSVNDKSLRMISYTLADAEFIIWPVVLLLARSFLGF